VIKPFGDILNRRAFAAQDEQSSIAESPFSLWISRYDYL